MTDAMGVRGFAARAADEADKWARVRAFLEDETDDPQAIEDTCEGESDLKEIVAEVMSWVADDEMMVVGIKHREDELGARRQRFERAIARKRAFIQQLMERAGQNSLRLPEATLSVHPGPRRTEITDESAIPAAYWKQPDPVVDKRALNNALAEHAKAAAEWQAMAERLRAANAEPNEPPPAPFPGARLLDPVNVLTIRKA